jgi:DNA-binding NarL/FixJ family response regulator
MDLHSDPTVWLDDSHAIFRRGMYASLSADGFSVSGESASLRPLPQLGGLKILLFECTEVNLRHVLRLTAGSGVKLVATLHDVKEPAVLRLVDAGVAAVLPHADLTVDTLIATLRAVLFGVSALPAETMQKMLRHALNSGMRLPGGLDDRERDVLRLLAEGSDTRDIATDLCFSERTVKNVVHDILMKMNCRTRAHAVALATRSGVI